MVVRLWKRRWKNKQGKIGYTWVAKIRLQDGRELRKHLNAKTKLEAYSALQEIVEQLAKSPPDLKHVGEEKTPIKHLGPALDEFLENSKGQVKLHTWRNYRFVVDLIMRYLPEKLKLSDMDRNRAERMFRQMQRDYNKNSPATLNTYLRTIKAIFNKLLEVELIEKNPFQFIKRLKVPPRKRMLTLGEVNRLINHAREHGDRDIYQFIMVVLLTGGRRSEIEAIRICDYDKERKLLRTPAIKTTGKLIPATGMLAEVLDELTCPDNNENHQPDPKARIFPYKGDYYVRRVRIMLDYLGIEMVSPIHGLRHTFATLNLLDGVDLRSVSKALGHTSQAVTEAFYAHDTIVAGGAAFENVERRLRGMCEVIVEDDPNDLEVDE